MDMNPIDIGQLLALLVFWYTTNKDKGEKAEELGKMKQWSSVSLCSCYCDG